MTKSQEIMREIIQNGPVSKKELQESTGISWGMVSGLTTQLVEAKFVVSRVRKSDDVGRKAEEFDVNPKNHFCIGVDLSHSGLLGVVTDLRGRVVRQLECSFAVTEKEAVLEEIYKMVDDLVSGCKRKKIWGIGFSVQGVVEIYEGVSVLISGIRNWRNVCLKKLLEERYGLPVYTEHDPNCVMLAERAVGCLKNRNVREVTLLSYDPRIGAGISIMTRGQLCHGIRGRAGEIGCNPVDMTQEGGWHHFEDYLYEEALLREYQKLSGREISYSEFQKLLAQEDSHCVQIYRKLGRNFGFALAIANNYLNPEVMVLDIMGQQKVLCEEISRLVRSVSFDPEVEIISSQGSREMKAIGAALISREKAMEIL